MPPTIHIDLREAQRAAWLKIVADVYGQGGWVTSLEYNSQWEVVKETRLSRQQAEAYYGDTRTHIPGVTKGD